MFVDNVSSFRIVTRVATVADVPAMVPVVNAAFAIETFLEGQRTDAAGITRMMENGEFVLAEDVEGRLVACVYTEVSGEQGYFGMLSVSPERQGKGVGNLMIHEAENRCRSRGCKFMEISVLSLRPELLPFYRKLGYRESRTEEFRTSRPLKSECHSIVMSKIL